MAKVGSRDTTTIICVQVVPNDFGGGSTARLDIAPVIGVYSDPAAAGSLIISSDDSYLQPMTVARKLASVGWRGVLNPPSNVLPRAECLTVAKVRQLQNVYS